MSSFFVATIDVPGEAKSSRRENGLKFCFGIVLSWGFLIMVTLSYPTSLKLYVTEVGTPKMLVCNACPMKERVVGEVLTWFGTTRYEVWLNLLLTGFGP